MGAEVKPEEDGCFLLLDVMTVRQANETFTARVYRKKTNKHRSIPELQFQCIDKWVTGCRPGLSIGKAGREEEVEHVQRDSERKEKMIKKGLAAGWNEGAKGHQGKVVRSELVGFKGNGGKQTPRNESERAAKKEMHSQATLAEGSPQ